MFDLEEAITERHSTRMFLPDRPVPRGLVEEALALAVRAPSNSNIQPWQMEFASGAARDRLVSALLHEARSRPPKIPPAPCVRAPATRAGCSGLRVDGNHSRGHRGRADCGSAQLGILSCTISRHSVHAPRTRQVDALGVGCSCRHWSWP